MRVIFIVLTVLFISCSSNNMEKAEKSPVTGLKEKISQSSDSLNVQQQDILFKITHGSYFGKRLPGFSLDNVDGGDDIEKEDLKGKYYLIYFWATWCKPCVANLEYLHELHEKYKNRNFGILCISHDFDMEEISSFRRTKWKMPWLNAHDSGKFSFSGSMTYLERNFNTNAIPFKIFVDPEGFIITAGKTLKTKDLEFITDFFTASQ